MEILSPQKNSKILSGSGINESRRGEFFDVGVTVLPTRMDEDAFAIAQPDPNFVGFGVFDGHGGKYASQQCSAVVCDNSIRLFKAMLKIHEKNAEVFPKFDYDVSDALFCHSIRATTKLLDRDIKSKDSSGTTVICLFARRLVDGSLKVYCSNIGDSRCVMKKGVDIVSMSEDHTLKLSRELKRVEHRSHECWIPLPVEPNQLGQQHVFSDEKLLECEALISNVQLNLQKSKKAPIDISKIDSMVIEKKDEIQANFSNFNSRVDSNIFHHAEPSFQQRDSPSKKLSEHAAITVPMVTVVESDGPIPCVLKNSTKCSDDNHSESSMELPSHMAQSAGDDDSLSSELRRAFSPRPHIRIFDDIATFPARRLSSTGDLTQQQDSYVNINKSSINRLFLHLRTLIGATSTYFFLPVPHQQNEHFSDPSPPTNDRYTITQSSTDFRSYLATRVETDMDVTLLASWAEDLNLLSELTNFACRSLSMQQILCESDMNGYVCATIMGLFSGTVQSSRKISFRSVPSIEQNSTTSYTAIPLAVRGQTSIAGVLVVAVPRSAAVEMHPLLDFSMEGENSLAMLFADYGFDVVDARPGCVRGGWTRSNTLLHSFALTPRTLSGNCNPSLRGDNNNSVHSAAQDLAQSADGRISSHSPIGGSTLASATPLELLTTPVKNDDSLMESGSDCDNSFLHGHEYGGPVSHLGRAQQTTTTSDGSSSLTSSPAGERSLIHVHCKSDTTSPSSKYSVVPPRTHRHSFVAHRCNNPGTVSRSVYLFSQYNFSIGTTRSIGDKYGARCCVATPEITSVVLSPGEKARFILGSDGFWEVFSLSGAFNFIDGQIDCAVASRKLAAEAKRLQKRSKRAQDDITCMVVDLSATQAQLSLSAPSKASLPTYGASVGTTYGASVGTTYGASVGTTYGASVGTKHSSTAGRELDAMYDNGPDSAACCTIA